MGVRDEQIEFVRPEPVDLGLQSLQAGRQDPVDPLATDLLCLHEPCLSQYQKVLADCRPGDRELGRDLADGSRLPRQQLQDASPVRLGSGRQGIDHTAIR